MGLLMPRMESRPDALGARVLATGLPQRCKSSFFMWYH